jgi:hypothetical protein
MHLYQVGNACARSWSRCLSADVQRAVHGQVARAITLHLEAKPLQHEVEKKQSSIRLKLWDDINANANHFRDAQMNSPDNKETRQRFGPSSHGDIGVFNVILEDHQTDFE